MAKLVDMRDVIECLEIGIKAGWTLKEFAENVDEWRDFVEIDDWKSVDEELPTEEMLNTWICFADGTVEEDTWTGKRGEEGIWASGERFTESGWYTYCDDHECRITHWKKQATPKPPIVYRMDEVG
jgi:hypothetical protein